jgi:hypothetical protein
MCRGRGNSEESIIVTNVKQVVGERVAHQRRNTVTTLAHGLVRVPDAHDERIVEAPRFYRVGGGVWNPYIYRSSRGASISYYGYVVYAPLS